MKLTDEEKQLVQDHRDRVAMRREKEEQQRACEHNWQYFAHGHNDDSYQCTRCGLMKWE